MAPGESATKSLKKRGRRALRACDACRRLKSRCIPSPLQTEMQCLRCDSLNIRCSFQNLVENEQVSTSAADSILDDAEEPSLGADSAEWTKTLLKSGYTPEHFAANSKLLHNIDRNVSRLLGLLERNYGNVKQQQGTENKTKAIDSVLIEAVKMMTSTSGQTLVPANETPEPYFSTEQRHFTPYLASPFTMVSQLVSRENLPLAIYRLHEPSAYDQTDDIVTMKLVTLKEATSLMQDFRERYGNWCSFPEEISTERLVENIRAKNASLLLSAACVMALRYTDQHHDIKIRIYKNLLYKLKSDLGLAMKCVPQTTEFIQAIVILSIYSSSFSSDIMSVDGWYISGIGIKQYLTKNISEALLAFRDKTSANFSFGLSGGGVDSLDYNIFEEDEEFEKLTSFRLWNHLTLVHITHCVFSGRMSIVDEVRADLCRRTLDLPNATNFDGRMVAEISLQFKLYNFMQQCSVDDAFMRSGNLDIFENINEELKEWLAEWTYLFSQPIQPKTQYVEFAYHYGNAIVLYVGYHKLYEINKPYKRNPVTEPGYQKPFRTAIGEYISQIFPVHEVLSYMPSDKQIELLRHCHHCVKTMVTDKFESFKYLSDQVYFSCVHSSLMCIMTAHLLYYQEKSLLHENELESILMNIRNFIERLRVIREGELKSFWVEEVDLKVPSVVLQYHNAILQCFSSHFPEHLTSNLK
ncbi:LAMI_0G11716g1_1 [Lachancea mirantina]|uniref:LAMI_0G11716g1_1 n=1 Tax=Lachancea mirantina TaxID=1230905 RepID=A0A1G4KB52_9SACH|nr:LAMI_0G11716g1_1 [Lachancea mirantina]